MCLSCFYQLQLKGNHHEANRRQNPNQELPLRQLFPTTMWLSFLIILGPSFLDLCSWNWIPWRCCACDMPNYLIVCCILLGFYITSRLVGQAAEFLCYGRSIPWISEAFPTSWSWILSSLRLLLPSMAVATTGYPSPVSEDVVEPLIGHYMYGWK
jgi:hypothetical protein